MGSKFLILCMTCDFFVVVVEHWTFHSSNMVTLEIISSPFLQGLLLGVLFPFLFFGLLSTVSVLSISVSADLSPRSSRSLCLPLGVHGDFVISPYRLLPSSVLLFHVWLPKGGEKIKMKGGN